MRTLVLGGSGQLGTEFVRVLSGAIAPRRGEFDLADTTRIEKHIRSVAPDLIINCAAYTAVDAAEEDEGTARLVNGTAVGELARAAAALGIPFVTFSSDYVFDGSDDQPYVESASVTPINAYGRSKALAEELALSYPGSLVIRTSWLLSATHPNFVTTILARTATAPTEVVDDQWGRPTLVSDLAPAVLDALDRGFTGVLHLASPPATTWFDLARAACRAAKIDPDRVVPCATKDYPGRALRPRYSVLKSERVDPLPDWRDGLSELVAAIVADRSM